MPSSIFSSTTKLFGLFPSKSVLFGFKSSYICRIQLWIIRWSTVDEPGVSGRLILTRFDQITDNDSKWLRLIAYRVNPSIAIRILYFRRNFSYPKPSNILVEHSKNKFLLKGMHLWTVCNMALHCDFLHGCIAQATDSLSSNSPLWFLKAPKHLELELPSSL